MLEEDVSVLVGASHVGMFGVQGVGAEFLDGLHVTHVLEVLVIPDGNLLNLVRGPESVEEVDEGNLSAEGGEMGHRGEVHDFLDVALAEHGETGLAAGHDVAVVTEDVQRVGRNGSGAYVEDGRKLFGGDFVHIRNHQEQALGSGVGGGEGTGSEGTVHGTCGTGFGLHLDNLDFGSEDVLQSVSTPLIDKVSHRAGRCDRVDCGNFGIRVADMRRGVVAVHGFHFSLDHETPLEFFFARPADLRKTGSGRACARLSSLHDIGYNFNDFRTRNQCRFRNRQRYGSNRAGPRRSP